MAIKNVINGRKVTPVSEIPFYPAGIRIPKSDVIKYGLDSVYRYIFARGQGGSCRDITWSKEKYLHECCGSKYPWRHFAACPKALRNLPDDLSDLKDI
jgi:hypothetical protein